MKIEKITQFAIGFRNAIEQADRDELGIGFKNFPRGSFADTTLLLGAFLTDAGLKPLDYIGADRNGKSHAWLECGRLIIDIKADQFEDCSARFIVAAQSPWHTTFMETNRDFADFRLYDLNTVKRLSGPYMEILRLIEG